MPDHHLAKTAPVEHADSPQSGEHRNVQDLAGQDQQSANDQRRRSVGRRAKPVSMCDPPADEYQALEDLEPNEQSREHVDRRGSRPLRLAEPAECGRPSPDRDVGDALEAENHGRKPEDLLADSGHDVSGMAA